jgi:DNA-directed RNA polymerase specialized sigma24 family protein
VKNLADRHHDAAHDTRWRSPGLASTHPAPLQPSGANCTDVASYGSLALDGSLPTHATVAIAKHLNSCVGCSRYVDQIAKTKALLGGRNPGLQGGSDTATAGQSDIEHRFGSSTDDDPELSLVRRHAYLTALARASDPLHADDLVQDTWDHFLRDDPTNIPTTEQLTAYLTSASRNHADVDGATADEWADALTRHHPHNPSDLAETDLPADPSQHEDWRVLADLDALDADADGAELYFPELYGDGPDKGEWAAQPAAWPSITRLLSPEDELQTSELYSVLDAALDELPAPAANAIYLVDIEGHSLNTAVGLLGRDVVDVQRDLVRARNHVRGRVNGYLSSS